MRKFMLILSALMCVAILLVQAPAQPPGSKDKAKDFSNSTIVTAIMEFDKDKTGRVTKEQVTDVRLHRLFDQADVNKKGVVTREQLAALAAKLETEFVPSGGGGPGKDGKGKDGKGKGGKGGPGGFGKGGPPQPGQILPPFLQESLNLTADQKKQLDGLQQEVDAKLGKILTIEQKNQLKEMRERGPGGPQGKGGPGKGPGG